MEKEKIKMVEILELKEKNMKKIKENVKNRMAVYIYIYISYIVIQKIK